MKQSVIIAGTVLLSLAMSCKNTNPLLEESPLFGGAPQFDKIKTEHYMPAFKAGIKEAKAEIDAIVNNPEAPTFANTIEALEYSGNTLSRVEGIFYNIMEADNTPELQEIAEEVAPLMNDYSMYVSLNDALFQRIKTVYESEEAKNLEPLQKRLLESTYKSFQRSGANLSAEDKEKYSALNEELSLLTLKFGKNVLGATNAYYMTLTSEDDLAGLPEYLVEAAAETAKEKGVEGWVIDLSAPMYRPFMKYSSRRDLREKLSFAYNTRAVGGEFDNTQVVKDIVRVRTEIAQLLGYPTFADYQLENKMVKNVETVNNFLKKLLDPTLPVAKKEVAEVLAYAKKNGFEGKELQAWDWSYWSEKYKAELYTISESDLKPYFQLDSCINAVFGLATKLYGVKFIERPDLPKYQEEVKIYEVRDSDDSYLALFYADFFPRATKRGGAWMTEFSGQYIKDGKEVRPVVSIVTNFSKPTGGEPALLTHDELETFLHEFGHSLHGMLTKGVYPSMTGTSVKHDFVELPSQIMENFAYEPEYLKSFAKHYKTGETIPDELIEKVVASRNYTSGYLQIRQLQFGICDMAWHTLTSMTDKETIDFEADVLKASDVLPHVPGTSFSTSITHLFSGGYAAGYYAYKWAEVLEADAFSLFKEMGIFNPEVSSSFRRNILSMGDSEDPSVIYRRFRGHDPEPEALLRKLGIIK